MEAFRRYDFRAYAQSKFQFSDTWREALTRKFMYREAFPQRFEDLYGFDGDSGDGHHIDPTKSVMPDAAKQRDNAGLWGTIKVKLMMSSSAMAAEVSSAELLYLSLTEANTYGLPPLDLDGINPQYIADTDGDGLLEFVDGWGQPLRFYSAPTALLRPDGNVYDETTGSPDTAGADITVANHQRARILIRSLPPLPLDSSGDPRNLAWDEYNHPLNIDPHDPFGDLLVDDNDTITFENFVEATCQSQSTYFAPLIVSPGPDQSLGLFEPTATTGTNRVNRLGGIDTANLGAIYDNLTNMQRGGL
jgi:hypothetical protein